MNLIKLSVEIKKERRGGSRDGAGRKKVADRDCKIAFGISAKAKENLEAYAHSRELSLREAANEIFENLSSAE